ncbi:MAG: hypothetical protein ACI9VR_002998 [Cognaticolwellia sp.]|jgi:hypothetical protein
MDVLLRHVESTPPLGQLAVYRGLLNIDQVVRVLDAQLDQPHKRFGELAVALGFCTFHDIESLVEAQQQREVSLQTLLVRQGAISPGRLALEMRRCARRAA